jgi:N-acyl-D-amino-acid deacylase
VYLPATQRQLVDLMREEQASAGETVVRILAKESPSAILRFGSEDDLQAILRNPTTSIACDCGASTETRTHPRYFGTFPRVLGHYVRETHVLTWEDAVRKMTALSASTIGVVDRGVLAAGMAADVTVFDPATVIDHATYDDPARPSDGIRDVVVNGRMALRDGAPTGERGGRPLIRTGHMPSRAMTPDRDRRVAFGGANASGLAFDVSQKRGARKAAGTLRIDDADANVHFKADTFGVLQLADGWASFTGRGRLLPARVERSVTVIVDRADPLADRGAQIIVEIEGEREMSTRVAAAAVRIDGR